MIIDYAPLAQPVDPPAGGLLSLDMYYVYAIRNNLNQIYIGQTENLEIRLARHNQALPNKKKSYTHKHGASWELFYQEDLNCRQEALKRERELKSYQGRLFLKKLL